jgi:hypothetical protein
MTAAAHTRLAAALLALALATAPLPLRAQAPPIAFQCPLAGTVTEVTMAGAAHALTNLGADPSDPALCRWQRGTAQGASLYGIFGPDTSELRGADIRRGMDALFAGATQVTFRFQTTSRSGQTAPTEDTWQRIDPQTLTIAGRQVATHVFLRTSVSAERGFRGVWRRWYDPVSAEWVKRELVEANQRTASDDYVASRLPLP